MGTVNWAISSRIGRASACGCRKRSVPWSDFGAVK